MFVFARDKPDLNTLAWPVSRLDEAIEFLARKGGLSPHPLEAPAMPKDLAPADDETLGRWIEVIAGRLGLEAEPVETTHAEVEQLVQGAGPALLRMPDNLAGHHPVFLALLKRGRWWVPIVGPDFSVHRVRPRIVRDVLCREIEAPWVKLTDWLLTEVDVPRDRQVRAQKVILGEQLGPTQIKGGWLLRLSPRAGLWRQIRRTRLVRPLLTIVGAYVVQRLLLILSWWVIGRGALAGHFDRAWVEAWALILFTAIPFQLLTFTAQGQFAIGAGGIFKQRLLYGTLQLEPEEIRHQGAGQFLGRVMESEAVEMLALGGGFMAVVAVIELIMASAILAIGAGGRFHTLLLLLWVVGALLISWRYWRRARSWVDTYREMTNGLVERMVGHRTRLAQQEREHWHDEEDQALDHYLQLSEKLDRIGMQLSAFIPRGWLILGLTGVAYVFVVAPDSLTKLAISLGGVLLALQALTSLVTGVQSVIGAMMAWNQVGPLFQAATRSRDSQSQPESLALVPPFEQASPENGERESVLVARDLVFRYHEQGALVLRECSLQIRQGERLLLQGPSGGGKSTLAALLTGLRRPESGLLLLRGFDRQTVGVGEWRRRVVMAPQFHENHVLTGTFAFNLLMGRRWPPRPEDLQEAESLCRDLGLGDLLDRMPSGLQQMVGESGWQLSHSERSRLYIARAILQKADLVILDESFGALDPENLHQALRCVLDRAPTLLVIAHP
jgi:ATP-binding cassette subfamily B protein